MTLRTFTVAAAKQDLDEVLRAVQEGPVSLTQQGQTVAVLSPPMSRSGCMAGTVRVLVDDIVSVDTSEDWGRLA